MGNCLLVLWFSKDDVVTNTGKLVCVPMHPDRNIEIDEWHDWIRRATADYSRGEKARESRGEECPLLLAVSCCEAVLTETRYLAR